METIASLMTGKGACAISCIEVLGPDAVKVVGELLSTEAKEKLTKGSFVVAGLQDNGRLIDQAVVGYEQELGPEQDRKHQQCISINCHGNPLINEMVMASLGARGVRLVESKDYLLNKLAYKYPDDAISTEAQAQSVFSKTLFGTKIIISQINHGLKSALHRWLDENDDAVIKTQCQEILDKSQKARLIIEGAKIIIAGAPNSGKSTLLNCLCKREKAIVADVEGTTRDWIHASCTTEKLWLDLYDTAGLDEALTHKSQLDLESQKRTLELIERADAVIYMIDADKAKTIDNDIFRKLRKRNIPVIGVINKIDSISNMHSGHICQADSNDRVGSNIEIEFNFDFDMNGFDQVTAISAKANQNIDMLIDAIHQVCEVDSFESDQAVCFTKRQSDLCRRIIESNNIDEIKTIIMQLLKDNPAVFK